MKLCNATIFHEDNSSICYPGLSWCSRLAPGDLAPWSTRVNIVNQIAIKVVIFVNLQVLQFAVPFSVNGDNRERNCWSLYSHSLYSSELCRKLWLVLQSRYFAGNTTPRRDGKIKLPNWQVYLMTGVVEDITNRCISLGTVIKKRWQFYWWDCQHSYCCCHLQVFRFYSGELFEYIFYGDMLLCCE